MKFILIKRAERLSIGFCTESLGSIIYALLYLQRYMPGGVDASIVYDAIRGITENFSHSHGGGIVSLNTVLSRFDDIFLTADREAASMASTIRELLIDMCYPPNIDDAEWTMETVRERYPLWYYGYVMENEPDSAEAGAAYERYVGGYLHDLIIMLKRVRNEIQKLNVDPGAEIKSEFEIEPKVPPIDPDPLGLEEMEL